MSETYGHGAIGASDTHTVRKEVWDAMLSDLAEARALLKLAGCKMQYMLNHGEWYAARDVVDRIEDFLKRTP